jgi:hypothetical protein
MTDDTSGKRKETSAHAIQASETLTSGAYRAVIEHRREEGGNCRFVTRFYAPGGIRVTLSETQIGDLACLFGDCAHLFVTLEEESDPAYRLDLARSLREK